MWKWVGVNVEGIVGVPATDLSDEEFAKYSAKVNAQHTSDQRGALANSGLYEYVEDEKPKVTKAEREKEKEEVTLSKPTSETDENKVENE